MRLVDLSPHFIRIEMRITTWSRVKAGIDPLKGNWCDEDFEEVTGPREHWVDVEFAQAHGILFVCPVCLNKDGHSTVWAFRDRGVPPGSLSRNAQGVDTRWAVAGSGYHDLTMQPSLLIQRGCGWHGFVTNGEVSIL